MRISSILTTAFAGYVMGSPIIERDVATGTSVTVGMATPLITDNRMIARATALPTCNPNNVAIVESQKPHSSIFCSNWRAAGTAHSAPVTVTGLNNAQISNICSCILTGTYVSNTPLTTKASTTSSYIAAAEATTYEERVLVHHNVHRYNHSAADLTWSTSLASTAAEIAASCYYAHNVTANGGGYGQNIAAGVQADNISAVITELFYNNEIVNFPKPYGQENPDMTNFENWGHFTQVVWASTTEVGCYTQDCSSSGLSNVGSDVGPYFTVCNYSPPGNYIGEFGTGVGQALREATVHWNYDL